MKILISAQQIANRAPICCYARPIFFLISLLVSNLNILANSLVLTRFRDIY